MKTKPLFAFVLGLLSCMPLMGQERFTVTTSAICSYYGEPVRGDIYSFASDSEAEALVAQIMSYQGLPQNFKIRAANVPNAVATINEQKQRIILYSQSFVRDLLKRTGTKWAATSIMAHEIGHHLAGHTLEEGGSRPELELQADKFSGHTLYKMGATLDDAKAAMEAFASEGGSSTHPPKSARLAAIHNGWISAQEQSSGGRAEPEPDKTKTPLPDTEKTRLVPRPAEPVSILTGTWLTSQGSMLTFTSLGASRYQAVESNLFGVIAEGTAEVRGGSVQLQIGVPFLFTLSCTLTIVADDMEGVCSGPGSRMRVTLERIR